MYPDDPFFFIQNDVKLGPQITHRATVGVAAVAFARSMLVMKVRKEPKEAIKVSEVTASHYIMCKSPWSFFHQLQYMYLASQVSSSSYCSECLMLSKLCPEPETHSWSEV